MARYMVLWELDLGKTPEDPKAKKAQLLGFQDIVMKHLKQGIIKEWGAFAGERYGYVIFEGNAIGLHTFAARWAPFVKFKVNESLTIEEVREATKALPD